jgi:hypothetical protein
MLLPGRVQHNQQLQTAGPQMPKPINVTVTTELYCSNNVSKEDAHKALRHTNPMW